MVEVLATPTEFVVRFKKERRAIPAISLTTDTSALTAIGNDFGFDNLFSRKIEAEQQQQPWEAGTVGV